MEVTNEAWRIKGSAMVTARDFFDERLQKGRFLAVAKEVGLSSTSLILPSSWYPVETSFHIFEIFAEEMNQSAPELLRDAVEYGIHKDLNGIYRFFMKLGGAQKVLSKGGQMASTYANFYQYKMLRNDPGVHSFEVISPVRLAVWTNHILQGALKGVLSACGAKLESFAVIESRELRVKGEERLCSVIDVRY